MRSRNLTNTPILFDRRTMLAGGGLLLLGGCSGGFFQRGASSHAGRPAGEVTAPLDFNIREGFAKLNAIRRKRLLPVYKRDPRLQRAAKRHAAMMGKRGEYGHDIGPGTDFRSRILASGFPHAASENIAMRYGSIDDVLQAWLDSPSHRRNMLNRRFRLAGLAYGFNTSGNNPRHTHFWVLIMGADDGRYS